MRGQSSPESVLGSRERAIKSRARRKKLTRPLIKTMIYDIIINEVKERQVGAFIQG